MVRRTTVPHRYPFELPVILNDNTIKEYRHTTRIDQPFTFTIGRMKDDIVNLPLATWTTDIDKRGALAIHSPGLPIGVIASFPQRFGWCYAVGIENLYLILSHEYHARITSGVLATNWCFKLKMQLAITKLLGRHSGPRSRHADELALPRYPTRGLAITIPPILRYRLIRAVEQDYRVTWRLARPSLDHLRIRTIYIMHAPCMTSVGTVAASLAKHICRHYRA